MSDPPRPAWRGSGEAADASPRTAGSVQPLSLRRNFSWTVAGNAATAAARWAIAIVLARLGNVEMIGQVMLAFAIAAPIDELLSLGLRGVQVTDAKHEYRFGDYLGLRLATTALGLVTMLVIAAFGGYGLRFALILAVLACGRVFESIGEVFDGLMQQHERMDRIGKALILQALLTLGLLAAGVGLTGSVVWAMAGFAAGLAITLLGYELPNAFRLMRASLTPPGGPPCPAPLALAHLRPRWNARTMLRLAWLALPLGAVGAMIALVPNLPRYMVSHYLGDYGLGIFAPLAALGYMGNMVATAIGQAATPRLAKYHAAGQNAAFASLLLKLLGFTAILSVVPVAIIAVAGRPILGLLYGPEFAGHVDLAVYLSIAAGLMYLGSPLAKAVQAMRRFTIHMLVRVAATLVLLALLPPAIRAYGLNGAAAAMIASTLFLTLAYAAAVLATLRRAPSESKSWTVPATSCTS